MAFVTIGKIVNKYRFFNLVTETETPVAVTDAEVQDLGQNTSNLSKK